MSYVGIYYYCAYTIVYNVDVIQFVNTYRGFVDSTVYRFRRLFIEQQPMYHIVLNFFLLTV